MKKLIKKKEYYVYVYLDPRKQGEYVYGEYNFLHEPIYVGKGKRKRAYYHEKYGKNCLGNILINMSDPPIVLIIAEKLSEKKAFELEKELIASIGRSRLGKGPLCNFTSGGQGLGDCKHTEETKQKMRKPHGLMSEKTKQKLREVHLGKKQSPEHTEKIRKSNTGKKRSKEICERMTITNKGKCPPHTEEWKRKVSIANTGRKHTEESKKKMSIAQKGRTHSEETKRKIATTLTGRKKSKESVEKSAKWHRGKITSEETREKMRQAAKMFHLNKNKIKEEKK